MSLLAALRGRASERELRLLACAFLRRASTVLSAHAAFAPSLALIEQRADGMTDEAFTAARNGRASWLACGDEAWQAANDAANIACWAVAGDSSSAQDPSFVAERAAQPPLIRCIVGNPIRPVAADPLWLTSTAVSLARVICEEGAFDRLLILADAFQDAGCESDDILNHCRDEGPHARGCWVVDLVLGKR